MTNQQITIGNKIVGNRSPCFLIAEVGQAHDGSLGSAHNFIDAAAKAGADAVKFQTHLAEAESTLDEEFRLKFSRQDESRFEYWKRLEFSTEQWSGLADHAASAGIIFLSSPFSVEAADILDSIGIDAWKIGSGEVNNPSLIDRICETDKPVLLSTGMSSWEEIGTAVSRIRKKGNPIAVFQCTSIYPSTLKDVGLNNVNEIRRNFQVPVGLSDHTGSIFPALAGTALGVDLIELHVVFNRGMFGPDTTASVTFEEFRLISDARDAFHEMQTHPVDKDQMSIRLNPMRNLFTKSVALRRSQSAGTILCADMLTVKKPGTGIVANDLDHCVGKRLRKDTSSQRILNWEDLVE